MTTKIDPFKYKGSGVYWKSHLKKYKFTHKDIETLILLETYDKEDIKLYGLSYSRLFDVVNSPYWANIIPESGESSAVVGRKLSEKTRKKISNSHKGKKGNIPSPEGIERLKKLNKGMKRPDMCIRVIHIESGRIFDSAKDAAIFFNLKLSNFYRKLREKIPCGFRYVDESYETKPKPSKMKGKKLSELARANMKANTISIFVKHKQTGQIFRSIADAANFIKISRSALSRKLKNGSNCEFEYYEQ